MERKKRFSKKLFEEVLGKVEAVIKHELSEEAKILDYRKSIYEDVYAIYVELPVEVFRDLDKTSKVAGKVIALSDELGIPFFCFFVPRTS